MCQKLQDENQELKLEPKKVKSKADLQEAVETKEQVTVEL